MNIIEQADALYSRPVQYTQGRLFDIEPEESDVVAGPNPKDLIGVNKPPLHLLPLAGLAPVAKVMEHGAEKYGEVANWRRLGPNLTIYLSAALRHIYAMADGEDLDRDTGLSHAAHAAACMLIILDSKASGTLIDDRSHRGAGPSVLHQLTLFREEVRDARG